MRASGSSDQFFVPSFLCGHLNAAGESGYRHSDLSYPQGAVDREA
jgi:hypothetical protein